MISIVLSDEQTLFRDGLRAIITAQPDLQVVADVRGAEAAPPAVAKRAPAVVLLSVRTLAHTTTRIIQTLTRQHPSARVLVLAEWTEPVQAAEARRLGAAGYLSRAISGADLCAAIRSVANGQEWVAGPSGGREKRAAASADPYSTLSPREREILQLLAEGYGNTAIAKSLLISPRTVETHRANVMRKLNLRTRSDLIRYAVRRGLLGEP